MKAKLLFGLLVSMMVVLTSLSACDKSTSSVSKPIEIIFCHSMPAQAPAAKVFKRWGDMIEQKSGDRVEFIYYWSNSLLSSDEAIKGVKVGTADVTSVFSATQNYMPLTYNIMYMPFMGYPSMTEGTEIYEQLYNKFQVLRDEFKGLKRLSSRMYAAVQIHTADKMVKLPSDLKGVKVACTTAGQMAMLVDMLGGAPVHMPTADMSMALNSGIVGGWFDHFPAIKVFGALTNLPHHTIMGEGGISMGLASLIMNPATFNKLPSDIQKIFEETSAWLSQELIRVDKIEIEAAMNKAKELDHTFVYLTPEEIELWSDAAIPLHQQWIAEMEAEGKPAKAIYDEARRLIKEYDKKRDTIIAEVG